MLVTSFTPATIASPQEAIATDKNAVDRMEQISEVLSEKNETKVIINSKSAFILQIVICKYARSM